MVSQSKLQYIIRYILNQIKAKPSVVTIFLLVILGVWGRFYHLGSLLPGLYVDETSIGYNAFALLKTGHDEHHRYWPVYFEAFGEWKNPIYIYSQSIVFSLMGISNWSLRLTSALWGLLAVILLGWFTWLLSKSVKATGLVVLLILFNPWHWLLSRVVFEVIALPTLLLLSLIMIFLYERTNKSIFMYAFALINGITFYSYTAARFISPALMVLVLLLWGLKLKTKIIGCLSLYGLFLVPAIWWEKTHPGSLTYAYYRVTGAASNQWYDLLVTIAKNYASHFSGKFLLGGGDGFLRHMIGFHSGLLWVGVPFLLTGLGVVIKKAVRSKFYLLLVCVILIAPLPSAVTTQAPHGLRSISLLPLLLMVTAVGLVTFIKRFDRKLIIPLFLIAMMAEVLSVYRYIRTNYIKSAEIWFDLGAVEQMTESLEYEPPYYLPESYYPSLAATWMFLKRHDPNDTLTQTGLSDTTFISYIGPDIGQGTYILNQQLCDQIKMRVNEAQVVFENYQGCVVTITSQPS